MKLIINGRDARERIWSVISDQIKTPAWLSAWDNLRTPMDVAVAIRDGVVRNVRINIMNVRNNGMEAKDE